MSEKKKISYESLNILLKEMFESGDTTYAKCSEVIRSSYAMGAERFTKQYKEAHSEWCNLKKEVQDKVIIENDTDRLELSIISKNEALVILSSIAKGNKKEVDGNIIVPSPKDQCGAIAEMSRIQGWLAPTKQANVNPDGSPLEPQKITMLPEQLEELKKAIESKK